MREPLAPDKEQACSQRGASLNSVFPGHDTHHSQRPVQPFSWAPRKAQGRMWRWGRLVICRSFLFSYCRQLDSIAALEPKHGQSQVAVSRNTQLFIGFLAPDNLICDLI